MNIGGLDPGVTHCGVAVVQDGRAVMTELWRLPRDFTVACARLRLQLQTLVSTYALEVLVVEDFHFHQQRERVSTAKVMYGLIGAARALHGWHGLKVAVVQAGAWGQGLTGQRPARKGFGHTEDSWKRTVAWYVTREAGPGFLWGPDPGFHRHDALGLAYYWHRGLAVEAAVARALAKAPGGRRR
jgi:Holliday junction resolvasome RuvABC endonuclease subunit